MQKFVKKMIQDWDRVPGTGSRKVLGIMAVYQQSSEIDRWLVSLVISGQLILNSHLRTRQITRGEGGLYISSFLWAARQVKRACVT